MEQEVKLRAQLSAARKQAKAMAALVWVLLLVSVGLSGVVAYLVLNRDVPLVALAPDVRDQPAPTEPYVPPPPLPQQQTSGQPGLAQLPAQSAVGVERRSQVIETLDAYARQDGAFSPCAPQTYNNSQIPGVIQGYLDSAGFTPEELDYMQQRYARLWQASFRQAAGALPADSQRRNAACRSMMQAYLETDAGKLQIDTPDLALGLIRQIMMR